MYLNRNMLFFIKYCTKNKINNKSFKPNYSLV